VGQDPEQIRDEIEQTRQEMGETVGAISYKTDLKSRTRDKVSDTKEKITGKASDVKDRVTGSAADVKDRVTGPSSGGDSGPSALSTATDKLHSATPDADEVKRKARRAASVAQENPLGLAVGSIALGFLAGALIPTTDVENEKIGPIADQLKDEAKSTGHEVVERGKAVAQQAQEAATTAMQAGQDTQSVGKEAVNQAQGLKDSVKESAQNVQSTAQRTAKP